MDRVKTVDWKILLLTALAAFIGSIGQLEFKQGADNLQFDIKLLLTNYHLIVAIAVYCLSTVLYVYALSKENLSILYPIIATSYIWTLLFSKIFLCSKMEWNTNTKTRFHKSYIFPFFMFFRGLMP